MTVGEVCQLHVVTAHPDETAVEAARRMRDAHVGDLVVTDSERRPVGILTDRDLVVSVLAERPDQAASVPISEVMTRGVVVAHRGDSLAAALTRMHGRGIRRLPVVTADGRLDGLLALDDVLAVMSAELNHMVGVVAREQARERLTARARTRGPL